MPVIDDNTLLNCIGKLCGQQPQPSEYVENTEIIRSFPDGGIGCSQLNELLLMLQFDRVSDGFFKYVFGESVDSMEQFKEKVDLFIIKSMIKFGHVKYSFKFLSLRDFSFISSEFSDLEKVDIEIFKKRHKGVAELKQIPPEKTPYLGYITQEKIRKKIKEPQKNRDSKNILNEEKEMKKFISDGKFNHECYLDYDYIDVYVATSMRTKIDFWNIANFVNSIFASDFLSNMKRVPKSVLCLSEMMTAIL